MRNGVGPSGDPGSLGLAAQDAERNAEGIAALTERHGEPIGLPELLDGLGPELLDGLGPEQPEGSRPVRRARPAGAPRLLGRATGTVLEFDDADQRDPRWWPQGICVGEVDEEAGGRPVLLISWYARGPGGRSAGSRLTVLDPVALSYRHVTLVRPRVSAGRLELRPVRVHAGGIARCGEWLHVAATGRGLVTFRLSDVVGLTEGGHVLPARFDHRPEPGRPDRMRHSFLSVDRSPDRPGDSAGPVGLLAGEYGRRGRSTRVVRYPLDPSGLPAADDRGRCRPELLGAGVPRMQGVVRVGDDWYVSVSQGPWLPGTVYVGPPGALRPHPLALPPGPEDLSWSPETDTLWSVTEHPGRRAVVGLPRAWFDRHRPWPALGRSGSAPTGAGIARLRPGR